MLKRIINVFVIVLSITSIFLLTSCDGEKYAVAEEYTYNADVKVHNNVIYYGSTHGWIAVSLEDKKAKEVTVVSYIDNKDVYAVAEGFLVDNDNVEVFNIPNGRMIYETGCVKNCKNLKEIYFI